MRQGQIHPDGVRPRKRRAVLPDDTGTRAALLQFPQRHMVLLQPCGAVEEEHIGSLRLHDLHAGEVSGDEIAGIADVVCQHGAQLVEPLCALVRPWFEQGVQREHIAGIVMAEVALPRHAVAQPLLPRPRLVLFDEPMIGLDPHAIKELKKVFEELRDSGCMVLVSTHMIDSMEELWDTTYIMKQGRVAAVVERENLKDNNKSLEDIFFEITEGAALEREV